MFDEVLLHRQSVVFEHTLAVKGDPFLEKLSDNPVYYEKQVYFIFNHEKATLPGLIQLIANSSTAQGFTAFLVSKNSVRITNDRTLQQIDQIAEAVKTIIIGVFDNETFLFWQRDK